MILYCRKRRLDLNNQAIWFSRLGHGKYFCVLGRIYHHHIATTVFIFIQRTILTCRPSFWPGVPPRQNKGWILCFLPDALPPFLVCGIAPGKVQKVNALLSSLLRHPLEWNVEEEREAGRARREPGRRLHGFARNELLENCAPPFCVVHRKVSPVQNEHRCMYFFCLS